MLPRSIVQFSWIYLASIVVSLVTAFYALYVLQTTVEELSGQGLDGTVSAVLVIMIFVFGVLVPLILWACVVFLASKIAKWIVVIFSVLGILNTLASMPNPFTIFGALGLITTVLTILAVLLLFMPDADAWCRERRGY